MKCATLVLRWMQIVSTISYLKPCCSKYSCTLRLGPLESVSTGCVPRTALASLEIHQAWPQQWPSSRASPSSPGLSVVSTFNFCQHDSCERRCYCLNFFLCYWGWTHFMCLLVICVSCPFIFFAYCSFSLPLDFSSWSIMCVANIFSVYLLI